MSNVQTAVAQREAQAPAQVSTADVVKTIINRQAQALGAVLPERLDTERYSRLLLTAIKSTPGLMAAFATHEGQLSVLLSAMQAAALGLEPNTPTQECWLLPRSVKLDGNWTDQCELSIGYKGYAKLARRSGQVKTLYAGVVREGDEFEWSRGLVDTFHHKPLADDDAPKTHAYAIARLTNGEVAFTVLTKAQVEKRRAVSESWKSDRARPYSPWTQWEDEQWCKTALRHLLTHGQIELSPELERAATTDEQQLAVDEDGMIDALVTDMPELAPPAPPGPPADNGDRQEPDTDPPAVETNADRDPAPSEPDPDGTVDPATWSGDEWRAQLTAHKRKPADAIRKAQEIAGEMGIDKPPADLDTIASNADLAVALYTWMTTK